MLGTVLGTADTSVNETKCLPSRSLHSNVGRHMIKTISKCIICQMMISARKKNEVQ